MKTKFVLGLSGITIAAGLVFGCSQSQTGIAGEPTEQVGTVSEALVAPTRQLGTCSTLYTGEIRSRLLSATNEPNSIPLCQQFDAKRVAWNATTDPYTRSSYEYDMSQLYMQILESTPNVEHYFTRATRVANETCAQMGAIVIDPVLAANERFEDKAIKEMVCVKSGANFYHALKYRCQTCAMTNL